MSWRQSLPSFPETYTSSRSFYYQRKLSRTIDHGRLGAYTKSLSRCDQVQCWSNSSHLVWELLNWLPFYMKPTQKSWEWGFGLVLAKEATIGLRLSFTEVWYEAHLHFPFYCPRPLKQHETNLIGSQGGNQLGTIVYLKIVYWTCLISIECSLNCAAVATQRLFCIELLLKPSLISRERD